MILTKYLAIQSNLETIGIVSVNMNNIEPLLEKMMEKDIITIEEGKEIIGFKSGLANTMFSLLEHIGFIKKNVQKDISLEFLRLTNFGRFLLNNKMKEQPISQLMTPFFLTWLPFKLFLKFIHQNPGADVEEIKANLGLQIIRHTTDLRTVVNSVIIHSGSDSPFNEKIIINVISNIGEFLGLITSEKKRGPYYLSPLGKYLINTIDFQSFKFKNIDPKLKPIHLALMDFLDKGDKNFIVSTSLENAVEMKAMHRLYIERIDVGKDVNILYKQSDFNAMVSNNSAFWELSKKFCNITYDQVKVLEFNSILMDLF